jgi:hypothetical protein
MGVGHRVEHLPEERQALRDRRRFAPHVLVERAALDVFHREPGLPVVAHAGVVQAGDARVLEPREDVALSAEAFAPMRPLLVKAGELQRHLALEAPVGLSGEPDLAHAAVPQRPQQREGTDQFAARMGARPGRGIGQARARLQAAAALRALVGGEQAAKRGCDLGLRPVERVEPGRARRRIHVERRIEHRLDAHPQLAGNLQCRLSLVRTTKRIRAGNPATELIPPPA